MKIEETMLTILELGKGGEIQKTHLMEDALVDEFVSTSDSRHIVTVVGKEVSVLKGYVTIFVMYLNRNFPGWKLIPRT
jgi:hypothetical protein